MSKLFLTLVNMSICAGWVVVAVILLRLLLKKVPRWIMGFLWAFVALRLVCPYALESDTSLIPSVQFVPDNILMTQKPIINSGVSAVNRVVNPLLEASLTPQTGASVNPAQVITAVAWNIWLIGLVGMVIYGIVSVILLRWRVREAVPVSANVMEGDCVPSPFILGLFRPKIYLPSSMPEGDRDYVIAHEQAHLKRRDHIWKPLGYLLLCIYWFQPLLWIGYILLCRDIELACDEKVIRSMGAEAKKPYAEALIRCSTARHQITACPLAFGEVGVKARVKAVLHYKKPAFWILLVSVCVLLVTAVCLLTNPRKTTLGQIEKRSYDYAMEGADFVLVSDTQVYSIATDSAGGLLAELSNLPISSVPASMNRSEDRTYAYGISFVYGKSPGFTFFFNEEFTEVWVMDSVKPTLTYRVLDPEGASQVYQGLAAGGTAPIPSVLNSDTYQYRSKEGNAFVLISQLDNGCTVSAGDFFAMGTYQENENSVTLTTDRGTFVLYKIFPNPESLWHSLSLSPTSRGFDFDLPEGAMFERILATNGYVMDQILFDIDGDGREEQCILASGVTSGLFTFCISVQEGNRQEYDTFILRLQSTVGSPRGYAASADALPPFFGLCVVPKRSKCGVTDSLSATLIASILPPTGRADFENPLCQPSPNLRIFRWGRGMRGDSRQCLLLCLPRTGAWHAPVIAPKEK